MNVSISLPDHLGAALQLRAAALGKDVGTFLTEVVTEQLNTTETKSLPNNVQGEFSRKLDELISRHGISVGTMDDSRESIYAGCGE